MPTHITIAPAQSSMKLSCDTHPFLNARPKPFVNVLYEIPDVKSDRFLLIIPLILAGFKLGINKRQPTAERQRELNNRDNHKPGAVLLFSDSFSSPFCLLPAVTFSFFLKKVIINHIVYYFFKDTLYYFLFIKLIVLILHWCF